MAQHAEPPLVINTVVLDMPIRVKDPHDHRPTVAVGVEYTITRFETYEKAERCGICETSDKAHARVQIRNESDGTTFYAGLNCLELQFGVDRSQLEASARPIRQLVEAWLQYVTKSVPRLRVLTETTQALEIMGTNFVTATSFDCPANERGQEEVQRLRNNLGHASRGHFDTTIELLLLLVGLQHDHKHEPQLFDDRLRSLNKHPKFTSQQRALVRLVRHDLDRLDWPRLEQLHELFRTARKAPIPHHRVRNVVPADFGSEDAYRDALRAHAQAAADGVTERASHIAQEVLAPVVQNQLENAASTLRKRGMDVMSFYAATRASVDAYELPPALRQALRKGGYEYYLTPESKPLKTADVSLDADSVRQRQRRAQLAEERSQSVREGFYRGMALWRPDKHHEMYRIWHCYGGPVEGRKRLENPLSGLWHR